MRELCPNCNRFVVFEIHEWDDRVEEICPKCGFRVKVRHFSRKWMIDSKKNFKGGFVWNMKKQRWEFIPCHPGDKPMGC